MRYDIAQVTELKFIGVSIRTHNAQALEAIGGAWQAFFAKGLADTIPNRVDGHTLLGLYTDYESDENGAYTFMIGAPVTRIDQVPDGMHARVFPARKCARVAGRGAMPTVVAETWQRIWGSGLARAFTVDYERYDTRITTSEVDIDIFLAV